jgi:hypothetical protein
VTNGAESKIDAERSPWTRHARWVTTAWIVGLAGAATASPTDLPTGIVAEPTMVAAAIRWIIVLWALALLFFGARMERATIATLLLVVGAGLGWSVAAERSITLALVCALLVVVIGMAVYIWVPRLAMAVAMAWPLPALYVAHLWFTGSFGFSRSRAIALAALGRLVGAVGPRRSLPLLSAALGTVLLLGAAPVESSMLWVLALSVGSVVWQIVITGAWRRRQQAEGADRSARPKGHQWARSVVGTGLVAITTLLWVILAAPMYDLDSVAEPARLERLAKDGELDRPGIVTFAPNNLYLSGRPLLVALVAERRGPLTRLWLPFSGRSLNHAVRSSRVVKDDSELEAMRMAGNITSLAFGNIRPLIQPGVSEAEIERRIVQSFVERGATGVAFRSIVGSGANAVLPHYDANNAVMNDGLVVIDIGCSVDDYASDMTRTFSVTGEYTIAQKDLIETVIAAGDAARGVIVAAGFGRFFNHGIGHHVGLQVHDPRSDPLTPGMVVTIEPGIYIPDGADTDPSYWNLGVRIEDTYIVTESGWEEITDYPRRPYDQ